MSIGPFEILVVLAVLALIIGPRRVTNMARSFGRGVQDFVDQLGDGKTKNSEQSAIGGSDDDETEEKDRERETRDR